MAGRTFSKFICVGCQEEAMVFSNEEDPPEWATMAQVCRTCEPKYPSSLLKAVGDEFDYALGLKDGTVFRFSMASLEGDFAHLMDIRPTTKPFGFTFDRGVEVRISEIAWCCDAPEGS